MNIDKLTGQGFYLPDQPIINQRDSSLDLIYLSLRTALHSFFDLSKAYRNPKNDLIDLDPGEKQPVNSKYIEIYYRTIIHFQHFFELSIKSILRSIDEMLPMDRNSAKNTVLIYKARNSMSTQKDIVGSIKTVEFSEALNRLQIIIKDPEIPTDNLLGIEESDFTVLKKLNELRNRIWHRGTYVLYFNEFVVFIGKYLLPAVPKFMQALGRANTERIWKFKDLNCRIDPIQELTALLSKRKISHSSIWQLFTILELGRAACNNPIRVDSSSIFWKHFSHDYQRKAIEKIEKDFQYDLDDCPVCGVQSLLIRIEWESSHDNQEEGERHLEFYDINCECCGYNITNPNCDPGIFNYYHKITDIL